METVMDTITIQVKTDGVEKASKDLKELRDTLKLIKSAPGNLSKTADNIDKLANSISKLNSVNTKKLAKVINTLSRLSSITVPNLSGLTKQAQKLSDVLNSMGASVQNAEDISANAVPSGELTVPVYYEPEDDAVRQTTTELTHFEPVVEVDFEENLPPNIAGLLEQHVIYVDAVINDGDAEGKFSKLGLIATMYAAHMKQAWGAAFESIGNSITQIGTKFSMFAKRMGRLTFMALFRKALNAILKDMSEAFNQLYGYSKKAGTSLSSSMDSITTEFSYFRHAVVTLSETLINNVAPVIERVVDYIVDFINQINLVMAKLNGQDTYTRAKKYAESYGDSLSDATKKAAGLKNEVLGFDELNVLGDDTTTDVSSYFETVAIDDVDSQSLQQAIDNVSGALALGGMALIGIGLLLCCTGNIPLGLAMCVAGAEMEFTALEVKWDTLSTKTQDILGAVIGIGSYLIAVVGLVLMMSGVNVPLGLGMLAIGAVGIWNYNEKFDDKISPEIKAMVAAILEGVGILMFFTGVIILLTGVNIPLGIGLMIGGAAAYFAGKYEESKLSDGLKSDLAATVGAILQGVGALMFFAGVILTCCQQYAIGIGLMIGGAAAYFAGKYTEEKFGTGEDLSSKISSIVSLVMAGIGGLMLLVGIIATMCDNLTVGIPLMIGGAGFLITGSVTAASMDGTEIQNKIKEFIPIITAISGLLLVIGLMLCIFGFPAALPIGLGLMAAGAAGLATAISAADGDSIGEKIKNVFKSIGDWWDENIQPHIDAFNDWVAEKAEKVSEFFISVGEKCKELWDTIVNWFGDAATATKDFVANIAEKASEGWSKVKEWWSETGEKVKNFGAKVAETADSTWDTVKEWWSDTTTKVKDFTANLGASFAEGAETIWNTITTWFGNTADAVKNFTGKLFGSDSSSTGVWDTIKGWFDKDGKDKSLKTTATLAGTGSTDSLWSTITGWFKKDKDGKTEGVSNTATLKGVGEKGNLWSTITGWFNSDSTKTKTFSSKGTVSGAGTDDKTNPLSTWISSVWKSVAGKSSTATVKGVGEKGNLWSTITGWFTKDKNGKIKSVSNIATVKGRGEDATKNPLSTWLSNTWDTITTSKIATLAGKGKDATKNPLSTWLSGTWNKIVDNDTKVATVAGKGRDAKSQGLSAWITNTWNKVQTSKKATTTGYGVTDSSFNNLKSIWSNVKDKSVKLTVSVQDKLKEWFAGVISSVVKGINSIINGINGIISGINKAFSTNISAISAMKVPDWVADYWAEQKFLERGGSSSKKDYIAANRGLYVYGATYTKYATGGYPDYGDLFIANESGAEMVGKIGNKTAVVNEQQIITSVSQGVATGVQDANAEQNALLREQNKLLQQLLNKEGSTVISTSQIRGALASENRRTGRVAVAVK